MIYLIYGDDTTKSHKELKKLVARFLKKKKNLAIFRVDSDSFSDPLFNNILKTKDLFSDRKLTISKRLISEFPGIDYISNNLEKFISSPDIFIFWEENLKDDVLKLLRGKINNIFEFSLGKKKKENFSESNNIFRVTDSFLLKQREKTWLLCQEIFLDGTPVEEVFWKILWQVKNLLSVKNGGGKKLHSFVYQKTRDSVTNFSEDELARYSTNLVSLYHESRRGKADIAVGLERIILRL